MSEQNKWWIGMQEEFQTDIEMSISDSEYQALLLQQQQQQQQLNQREASDGI